MKTRKEKLNQVLELIDDSWCQIGDVRKSVHPDLTRYVNETLKELKTAVPQLNE